MTQRLKVVSGGYGGFALKLRARGIRLACRERRWRDIWRVLTGPFMYAPMKSGTYVVGKAFTLGED